MIFTSVMLTVGSLNPNALAADEVIKWKCQVVYPTSSPSYEGSTLKVINEIKKQTNGRLNIEVFPAGALVPAQEIYNAVQRGMIQSGMTSGAYLINKMPIMAFAAGLPFSFQNVWEGQYFHKKLGLEDMLQKASEQFGVYYFSDRVYVTELALKKPVTTFEDFKGLKLRSSGLLQKMFTAVGAAASYLPGPEVYPALASGVVDGAHWGAVQGSYQMGFYEVCKYTLKPALNVAGTDAWLFNQKAFDDLPKDIQNTVRQILEKHFWERSNEYIYLENITLAKVQKELGVKITGLAPDEQKKLTRAAMVEWDKIGERDEVSAKALKIMKDFLASLGHI